MADFQENYVPVEARFPDMLFPSKQLRWALRECAVIESGQKFIRGPRFKVLQQLWRSANGQEEWRDIPEEVEAATEAASIA